MIREPVDFKQAAVVHIPSDWQSVKLDDVAKRGSGHTPDKKHPEYWNGDIKWVSLRDSEALDRLFIAETAASITSEGIANSSAVLHPDGTVILSRDAGVGKSAILGSSMAVSQHFMAWQCGPRLDNVYLYYWLQHMKPEFERIAMGSTIKTIGLPYFQALRILLPPREEQRAIATALRHVDESIEGLQGLIAKKRDLKQAAMQKLLTRRSRLRGFEGAWQTAKLGALGRFLKGNGVNREEATSGDLPCVRYGELYTQHHDYIRSFGSWISEAVARMAVPVRHGDILFAGSGETRQQIGKCAAIVGAQEAYAGGDIVIFRPYEADPRFLGYYLNTPAVCAQKASLGQGDAVVHISATALSSIDVCIPSTEEQSAIGQVLSDFDEEIDALQDRLEKVQALKQGMMQQLLTGRICLI